MIEYTNRKVLLKETSTHPQFNIGGEFALIEGYWKDIAGKSWMHCNGNPACIIYALRSADNNLPTDDNVVYGKINGLGVLIHTSEIASIM